MAVAQRRLAIGRRPEPPFRLLDEIIDDRSGFGDRPPLVLDHPRLAERMGALQRRRRQHRLRIGLVAVDLIGQLELLEQPEDALRARIFEMVDDDHASVPAVTIQAAARKAIRPAASRAAALPAISSSAWPRPSGPSSASRRAIGPIRAK